MLTQVARGLSIFINVALAPSAAPNGAPPASERPRWGLLCPITNRMRTFMNNYDLIPLLYELSTSPL